MALIGIYSDVHISHNSSILPTYLNSDDAYTTRLKMCKESIQWAYKEFEKENVDMIVNCGDTFNSHTVSSDEISAYIDAIKNIHNLHQWKPYCDVTLLGNHDKFNDRFNSVDMLRLIDYSNLVQDYYYYDAGDCDIYCISFYESKYFVDMIHNMLSKYPRLHDKAILFMHGDINGSTLSGTKKIENHIGTDFLTKYFNVIINGHIHCHERIYNQNNRQIYNIGSLTSHSFADSNNHIPACYILNTNNNAIRLINNPHAILFKSYVINNDNDLYKIKKELEINNKVILKVKCPFDMKEDVENYIKKIPNILKYKFIFIYENIIKTDNNEILSNNLISKSIKDEFITFLNNREDLKGNIDDYIKIILR